MGARTEDLLPYALLLPCIVFLALLILIPMVQALLLAVQADTGGFTTEYLERMRVGWEQFFLRATENRMTLTTTLR